jgi:PKD repeat protein
VAVLLLPESSRSNYFGRLMSHCEKQIRITSTGELEVLSEIPQVTFTLGDAANPLRLTAQATLSPDAEISWEFGDNSARQFGASQEHNYAKPGKYTVTLRIVNGKRQFSEFRADVVVSRSPVDGLRVPVTAFPTLTQGTISDGHTQVNGILNTVAGDPVIATWRVGKQPAQKGDKATFELKPGEYTVAFTAVRPLKACVYSKQRFVTEPSFKFNGLNLATNRRFELDGTEITGVGDNPPVNSFTTHLFGGGAMSPVDQWMLELPASANPFLRSVSATDVEQYDLSEIQDAVLVVEYETTPGSSYA